MECKKYIKTQCSPKQSYNKIIFYRHQRSYSFILHILLMRLQNKLRTYLWIYVPMRKQGDHKKVLRRYRDGADTELSTNDSQ